MIYPCNGNYVLRLWFIISITWYYYGNNSCLKTWQRLSTLMAQLAFFLNGLMNQDGIHMNSSTSYRSYVISFKVVSWDTTVGISIDYPEIEKHLLPGFCLSYLLLSRIDWDIIVSCNARMPSVAPHPESCSCHFFK